MPRNSTSWGVTNTFRRTSKLILDTYGSNLQNQTKKSLEIYTPSCDKNVFIQGDQKVAESLIVSYLIPHGKLRDLHLNNIAIHSYVASHIFRDKWKTLGFTDCSNNPINSLSSNKEWRRLEKYIKEECNDKEYFIGKKCGHSLNYRMKPPTLREDILKESDGTVTLSKQESEFFYETYHSIIPEISQAWWPEIEYQVRKTGYLYNLFGFPRYCQGPYIDKTWRELTAFIPQSTVGCITATAFCDMQDFIEKNRLQKEWHLLNDKHDSILIEAPSTHAMKVAHRLKIALEPILKSPRGEEFQMKAEIGIGRNWAKYHPIKNPQGIKEISFSE